MNHSDAPPAHVFTMRIGQTLPDLFGPLDDLSDRKGSLEFLLAIQIDSVDEFHEEQGPSVHDPVHQRLNDMGMVIQVDPGLGLDPEAIDRFLVSEQIVSQRLDRVFLAGEIVHHLIDNSHAANVFFDH